MTPSTSADTDRRRIAAEVLELGETLFDAALEAAAHPSSADGEGPFPEAEMRVAADEFFQAVRALLGVAGNGAS